MIISLIFSYVSKDISASIIYGTSVYKVWDNLKDRFQQKNRPFIFKLRRDLMNLAQDQNTVSIYFTKLKNDMEGIEKLSSHPLLWKMYLRGSERVEQALSNEICNVISH